MSILDSLQNQLRSVIEWKDTSENELFYRWSKNQDEIKNASKLIVSPAQGCIFIYEGKIRAVFDKEGIFDIRTSNIPFITTIKKFMQFFESEHKTAFYFYRKSIVADQKWGTVSPIKYLDPVYKFPIELMAFGNYSFKITDPKNFFISFVGEREIYTTKEFRKMMNARLVHTISDFFAESKFSYIDIDANREEIVKSLNEKLKTEFLKVGFALTDFRIEGTAFDEGTKKRIEKIADTEATLYAAQKAGISFSELRRLDALNDAAKNEGGSAGVFMGANIGNSLSMEMNKNYQNSSLNITERLKKLKELYDMKLIDKEDFLKRKEEILKEI